jgi:hypothetical protein
LCKKGADSAETTGKQKGGKSHEGESRYKVGEREKELKEVEANEGKRWQDGGSVVAGWRKSRSGLKNWQSLGPDWF